MRWRVLKTFNTHGWTCANAIASIFTQGNRKVPGIHTLCPCEIATHEPLQGLSLYGDTALIKQTTAPKHHHYIGMMRQLRGFV